MTTTRRDFIGATMQINMKQLEDLVTLQQIESETSEVASFIEGVDGKLAELDSEIAESERMIEEGQARIDGLNKKYRDCEHDVQANQSVIGKNKGMLNTVKSNKEYQALLKGIDELEKKNSGIEDEMIAHLDRIEEAEKDLSLKREDHGRDKQRVEEEKAKILAEAEEKRKRMAELETERNRLAESIDAALLSMYNEIREKAGGIAITPVRDSLCLGCRLNIPPQMYNELQQNEDLKFCPHCQRMIYWEKA